jgi:hypothetical protein
MTPTTFYPWVFVLDQQSESWNTRQNIGIYRATFTCTKAAP